MTSLGKFNDKWSHPAYPPDRASAAGLSRVEATLGAKLPAAYREQVLAVGLPRPTAALLHSIVEAEADLRDISDFFEPEAIIQNTLDWRGMGLPGDHVAFGCDCSGSLFTFLDSGAPEVWFFDHDMAEIELIADSFDAWLLAFEALIFVPWDKS